VVATRLDQLTKSKDGRLRFEPLDAAERQKLAQRGQEVQKLREERRKLEAAAVIRPTGKPSKEFVPARVKLPGSPIAAKPAGHLDKDHVPPKTFEPSRLDPKVEPKPKRIRPTSPQPAGIDRPDKKSPPEPKAKRPDKKSQPEPKADRPDKKSQPEPKADRPDKKPQSEPKADRPDKKPQPEPKAKPPDKKSQPDPKADPSAKKPQPEPKAKRPDTEPRDKSATPPRGGAGAPSPRPREDENKDKGKAK
jgi:hypothetical protein